MKKPRYNPELPGPLAELEAQWLRDNKDLDVTAAQVRGILMYHSEFQKSPERAAQRRAEQEARAKRDAEHQARQVDRTARLRERARKTAELADSLAKRLEEEQAKADRANGTASPTPDEPTRATAGSKASRTTRRNSKTAAVSA
ncbi:hypothetical protein A5633_23010 [Mycolicibacterium elephantis]|nr:hypothetical protein A5633_23010 [Mycolicibacterium elephantis]